MDAGTVARIVLVALLARGIVLSYSTLLDQGSLTAGTSNTTASQQFEVQQFYAKLQASSSTRSLPELLYDVRAHFVGNSTFLFTASRSHARKIASREGVDVLVRCDCTANDDLDHMLQHNCMFVFAARKSVYCTDIAV